jgi:hypothetical protein
MRIEVIFCQVCNHKLRVPEDLMGKPVQCPECKSVFIAPPPNPEGGASTAIQETARQSVPSFQPSEFDRPEMPPSGDSDAKVLAPAFTLLAVALLGMLLNIVVLLLIVFQPDLMKQSMAMFKPPPGLDVTTIQLVTRSVFLLLSFVAALGAIAMMKRTLFPLAVVGSLAAIFNFADCCCILGAPAGIWALIVLFQSDVRASFR